MGRTRKIIFSVIAILTLCVAVNARAEDLLVLEYRAAKNTTANKQWISAAGEALTAANFRLQQMRRPSLYCPPEKMRLMTENYISILELELIQVGKKEMNGIKSVADVLLDGLIRTFPCKQQE